MAKDNIHEIDVFLDPRARISYASFYIQGLFSIFGESRIKFSSRYFKDLVQQNGIEDFDHYFAFIITEKQKIKKIVIDYRDKGNINLIALRWCDVYGKVNYNKDIINSLDVDYNCNKIISLGPNFGIKIWNDYQTYFNFLSNYFKSFNHLPVSIKTFLSGYNWQRVRPSLSDYVPLKSESNYIFFISTLYSEGSPAHMTNQWRATYIRQCLKKQVNFEGGLLANPHNSEIKSYKDIITKDYVQSRDYLMKIRKSSFVFNTPAVWGCLGWKLGEFLALGKAIISTPLTNEMPFPFEHGKHVHYVNSEQEIKLAIDRLTVDLEYRQNLEQGALTYYNSYLSPQAIIKRLINC